MVWGENDKGLVMPGQVSQAQRLPIIHTLPATSSGSGPIRAVAVGDGFMAAVDGSGVVWAWGKALEQENGVQLFGEKQNGFTCLLAGHDVSHIVASRGALLALSLKHSKIIVLPVMGAKNIKGTTANPNENDIDGPTKDGDDSFLGSIKKFFFSGSKGVNKRAPVLKHPAYYAKFEGNNSSGGPKVEHLAAGLEHAVVVEQGGKAVWSMSLSDANGNRWGQLGTGATPGKTRPLKHGGSPSTQFDEGQQGKLWSAADEAWLGTGTSTTRQPGDMLEEHSLQEAAKPSYGEPFRRVPVQDLQLEHDPIKSLACGWHHTLLLTQSGSVIGWGSNESLQLGQERFTAVVPKPIRLNLPMLFAQIGCGAFTSFGSSRDGRIVAFGYGLWGQLGNGQYIHMQSTPTAISTISQAKYWDEGRREMRPRQLAYLTAGRMHAAAVLASVYDGDDVFVWGGNKAYQLGTGRHSNEATPVSPATSLLLRSTVMNGARKLNGNAVNGPEEPVKPNQLVHDAGGQLELLPGVRMLCAHDVTVVY